MVCPTIIGREPHLASIHQLLDQLAQGNGATVLISGEAGIGKTRLVAEAGRLASGRGVRVLWGAAFELDQALAYGPVADLLHSFIVDARPEEVIEVLGPAVAAVARLIPSVAAWLPRDADRDLADAQTPDDRRQLRQGLLAAFDRLIAQSPTLVVIEDVHWADEASLDLLLHLARSTATRPLLLFLTLRPEDMGPTGVEFRTTLERMRLSLELPLEQLSRAEVATMIECLVGRAPDANTLETISGLTEGNPFFVEEVVRTLSTGNDLRDGGGIQRVPRTVHDAVQRRVSRLGESARRAIQVAAVAGRRFDLALLQALLGLNERDLLAVARELVTAQLVVEESDDRFAFRHALTRQAVYSDLLGRERRTMHAEVLAALEQVGRDADQVPAEELSYHAYAAGAWPKTLLYASLAGDRALGMHAPRAAVEHFGRAIHAAEALGQAPSAQVLRGCGLAYASLGQFELARADFETALEAAAIADTHLAWQLLVDLSLLWAGRDYAIAGEYAQRSLAAAHELKDQSCIARSLDRVGNWHLNVGRVSRALDYQRQALALLESLGDRRGVADTLNLLGMTSAFVDSAQSALYYERAIPLIREVDDRQGLVTDLVMHALQAGFYYGDTFAAAPLDPVQSEHDADEAIRLARTIDWPAGESFAQWQLALWYGMRGSYGRAFELAVAGTRVAEEIEHRQWIAGGLCSIGALYLDVLAPKRAQALLERALSLGHQLGSLVWVPYASAFLARAFTLERDFSQATAVLERELREDTPCESAPQRQLWCARAQLSLARGAAAEALGIADKLAATLLPGTVAPCVWIVRGEALTALRSLDEAEQVLAEAVEASRASELRSLQWRSHAAFARLLRMRGRRDEADGHVQAARSLVQALAADLPEDDVRTAFVERASRHIPHSGLASERRLNKQASGGLTAREREVAGLIARGLTNRAIAETLVVSERTVESYTSSILAKLGFNARTQIAAWAATRGIAAPPQ